MIRRAAQRICLIVLAAISAWSTVGCEQADDPTTREVVVYVSADEYVAREVIAAFEAQSDINVEFVGDTEAQKTTGLVERLRSEQNNPQADVFWSSEIFLTIALADEGVLSPYVSDATTDWPRQFRAEDDRWYGFGGRARVFVFNPSRLAETERPQHWMDLIDPKWSGRIVMADPRFGTTGGHLGAMQAFWDSHGATDAYQTFIDGLAANEARLLPSGNAGVVAAVASGEADIGLTDTDDVWAAQEQGLDVALIYPSHDVGEVVTGTGTLVIPNTAARVTNGPNPDTAGAFIDFLVSEHVERLLAESASRNIPLRPGLSDSYPELQVPDPIAVDYRSAASARENAVAYAMQKLRDEMKAADAR